MAVEPKWKRRKEARPNEIIAAAVSVFAERGFAAARMEDIAGRAGVSKGSLYLYFPTKEDLFEAVVRQAVAPGIDAIQANITASDMRFADLLRMMLPRFAELMIASPFSAVVKMVVGESGNFPELARVWYNNVVLNAVQTMSLLIANAQDRGEIRPGDPRTHAFSIMGPILMGLLWHKTFTPVGGFEIDLPAVARQHIETILDGLLTKGEES